MKTTRILIVAVCLFLGLTARAQDTKSQYNPITQLSRRRLPQMLVRLVWEMLVWLRTLM